MTKLSTPGTALGHLILAGLVAQLAIYGCSRPRAPVKDKAAESPASDAFSGLPPDSTRLVAIPLCDGMGPSLSPDGRLVAFVSWNSVWLYDIQAGTTRRLCQGRSPSAVTWSPAGTQLAFNGSDFESAWNGIWIVNADGSDLRKLGYIGVDDQHPIWSPDEKSLVWTRVNRLWQGDVNGAGGRFLTKTPPRFHQEFARGWAADGTHLFYIAGSEMGGEYRLRIVGPDSTDDIADSSRVPVVSRDELGVADDGVILFRGAGNSVEFIERGARGRVRRCFIQDSVHVWRVSLARDKSIVVFDDGEQHDPRLWLVHLRR